MHRCLAVRVFTLTPTLFGTGDNQFLSRQSGPHGLGCCYQWWCIIKRLVKGQLLWCLCLSGTSNANPLFCPNVTRVLVLPNSTPQSRMPTLVAMFTGVRRWRCLWHRCCLYPYPFWRSGRPRTWWLQSLSFLRGSELVVLYNGQCTSLGSLCPWGRLQWLSWGASWHTDRPWRRKTTWKSQLCQSYVLDEEGEQPHAPLSLGQGKGVGLSGSITMLFEVPSFSLPMLKMARDLPNP